jgi:hypothetical protein
VETQRWIWLGGGGGEWGLLGRERGLTSEFLRADDLFLLVVQAYGWRSEVGHDQQELPEADLMHRANGVSLPEISTRAGTQTDRQTH